MASALPRKVRCAGLRRGPGYPFKISVFRNWMASARCSGLMSAAPSRSAMVRATRGSVMRPGGEAHPLEGGLHQRIAGVVQAAELPDHGGGHVGVAGDAGAGKAGGLDSRAASTRHFTSAELSGVSFRRMDAYSTAGTLTWRSIRSSRGPEIFSTYRATSRSEQVHRPEGWPRPSAPAGVHGAHQLEAGGQMQRASGPATVTSPSSRGWRRASRTSR